MPDNKTQKGFEFLSKYDRFELKALRQVTERHTPYIKVEEIPQEGPPEKNAQGRPVTAVKVISTAIDRRQFDKEWLEQYENNFPEDVRESVGKR